MIDPSLKVLFCAFQVVPEPSGASARTTEFLRALQGLCVVDALTAKSPDVGHIERYLGARLMRVPVGAGDLAARSQAFERAVVRQLDSDEYQIIQFSDPFAGAALLDLKAKLRFKLVYDAATFPSFDLRYTDPHLEGDRSFMTKLKRDELLCLMGADAVLTGSTVKRDHIVSLGVPQQRITVIPPLVDLKPFLAFAGSRPDRIPMRLLYMGSQVAWQGLPTLLFALKDALKNPAAGGSRLSILGPRHPDWRDQLEQQVKASGMGGNVDFLDPVAREELPRVIAQHDVGVAPLEKSDRNLVSGGPVVKLAEYAAAGLAIIASDLPVTRGLVDERAALFFAPSRESALSAAIVALARDPMKRVQMGQAARTIAAERFDTQSGARQLLAVYASLGAQAPGQASSAGEVDIPTSVGAELPVLQEDTGAARVGPAEVKTGKIPIAGPEQIELPPEPTPVVPGVVAPRERPPEPVPPPPPPLFEVGGAPVLPAQREDLFGTPGLFSEEAGPQAPEEAPILMGAPHQSGATLMGELVSEAPQPLPNDIFGLPDLPPEPREMALPPPASAPRHTAPRLPPRGQPGMPGGPPTLGPPTLAPARPAASRPAPASPPAAPQGAVLPPSRSPVLPPPPAAAVPAARPPSRGAVPPPPPAAVMPAARPPSRGAVPPPPPAAVMPAARPPSRGAVPPPPPAAVMPDPVAAPPAARPPSRGAVPPPPPAAAMPVAVPPPPPVPSMARPATQPAPLVAPVSAPPPVRPPSLTGPVAAPPQARVEPTAGPPAIPRPISSAGLPAHARSSVEPTAPLAVQPSSASPAPGVSGLLELSESDFDPLEEEPELVDADAVEAVAPAPPPVLQNSVELGGPDAWFHALVLGFAPLGQLGAAPVRGSPLSASQPLKI